MIPRLGHFTALPPTGRGQRIGLLGGSFDPPHAGHAHVAKLALTRLCLDAVWIVPTPGNPLKDASRLSSFAARATALRRLLPEPRIRILDIEAHAGLRYSRDLVRYLLRRAPGTRFVWLMGADNLASFHRWHDWRGIAARIPIAVIDRPGANLAALHAPAARALAAARVPESAARAFADCRPPAWIFLHGRLLPHASTALRAARHL